MREKIVDFFEKLDDIKIEKKQLMPVLIALEILGILVLVWYLRAPLTQKYLTISPRTYSIEKMDTRKRYFLAQDDFLVGKTKPNSSLKFFIKPGDTKIKAKTDQEGVWRFQIPNDIKEGKYRLTVAFFGTNSKLYLLKTYKVTIRSDSLLKNLRFDLKKVHAQTDWEVPMEDFEPAINQEGASCSEDMMQPLSCDLSSCGRQILSCSLDGRTESVEDLTGACSDPEINPGCGYESSDLNYTPYFNQDYIVPDRLRGFNSCVTEDQIDDNRNKKSCRYLSPAIDLFDTYIDPQARENFIQNYKGIFIQGKEGDENEFRERVALVISKSQSLGLNPAIFLGYWYAESRFSTARDRKGNRVADFGCDPTGPVLSFEEELNCALGLTSSGRIPQEGEPYGSSGPRCALSGNPDSYPCRLIWGIREDNSDAYRDLPVSVPIRTFDDLFETHGSISSAIDPNNCSHSYNETLKILLEFNECGISPSLLNY